MKIFKKEKQVAKLALRHTDLAGQCVGILVDAIEKFIAEGDGELTASAARATALETEADDVLREIRELLYSGAYLPVIRGDLYRLLSEVDRVANRVESCINFVSCQRPLGADRFGREFGEILDLTRDCFEALREASLAFFKAKGKLKDLRESSRRVGELESAIDEQERALAKKIFDSDLPLAQKLHLAQLLTRIGRISNQVENAADELELLSLKSII